MHNIIENKFWLAVKSCKHENMQTTHTGQRCELNPAGARQYNIYIYIHTLLNKILRPGKILEVFALVDLN